jgi:hypothetical protein
MVICYNANGQNTNVVLPPLIDVHDLKTTTFNNGENLVQIREENDSDFVYWKKNSNRPTVFILKSGNYLYNIKALNNSKNLCPQGKHVILEKDIYEAQRDMPNRTLNIKNQEILTYTPSCHEPAYFTKEKGFFLATGDPQFFEKEWSIDLNKFDSLPHFNIFNFKEFESISCSVSSGGPTRCTYDSYTDLFKQEIFKCQEIMPENYLNFQNSLQSYFAFETQIKASAIIELKWENNNGRMTFKHNEIGLTKKSNEQIEKLLKEYFKKPFYNNVQIHTIDNLVLTVVPNPIINSKVRLSKQVENRSFGFDKYSSNIQLNSLMNESLSFDAKAIVKSPNNLVFFSGVNKYNDKNGIKRVVCPGPIYALASIVPGLGILRFKNAISDKYVNPTRRLLITAISIGGIGIASKITSIHFYNEFLRSINFPSAQTRSYNFANATQKVFVVSSAIYGALFLVDFTWSFSLGIKSKHIQQQTNSELRKMHKKGIWI